MAAGNALLIFLSSPIDIAYNPSNDKMYVLNSYGDIDIIYPKLNKIIENIQTPLSAFGGGAIAYNPSNDKMYALGGGTIYTIDTSSNKHTSTIPIGAGSAG